MEQNIFIGTYSENGIYKFNFNNGVLTELKKDNSFENCSYLCSANNLIYSIIEYSNKEIYKNGYIYSSNFNLIPTSTSFITGKGPCFITIYENKLYIGNYGDGSIDVFSLDEDGKIASQIYHKNPYSNTSRAHCILPYKNFLFVTDLGTDNLFAYKILFNGNTFELKEFCSYKFPANCAPRHIANIKNELYIITENSCELYRLSFSEKSGFKLIESISLLPINCNPQKNYTGCALKISKDNNFIYTCIRGHNSISTFKLKPELTLLQNIPCLGNTPRDLFIDNSQTFLLCANQASNNISIFSRNTKTGLLYFENTYPITAPACII